MLKNNRPLVIRVSFSHVSSDRRQSPLIRPRNDVVMPRWSENQKPERVRSRDGRGKTPWLIGLYWFGLRPPSHLAERECLSILRMGFG